MRCANKRAASLRKRSPGWLKLPVTGNNEQTAPPDLAALPLNEAGVERQPHEKEALLWGCRGQGNSQPNRFERAAGVGFSLGAARKPNGIRHKLAYPKL